MFQELGLQEQVEHNNKSRHQPVGGHMTDKGPRISRLIGGCLAVALPCLAVASPPSDAAAGQIDAILNFCARSDRSLEKNAEIYRKLLTGSGSPRARGSVAYEHGYQQVSDALEKGNHGQEVAACVAGLTEHKSGDRDDHHEDGHRRGSE